MGVTVIVVVVVVVAFLVGEKKKRVRSMGEWRSKREPSRVQSHGQSQYGRIQSTSTYNYSTTNIQANDTDVTRHLHAIFQQLQRKFGFQRGSVENQQEHYHCLIANKKIRLNDGSADIGTMQNHHEAVDILHAQLFANYQDWCNFLQVEATHTMNTERKEHELALWLLIWGESGNLRFTPECLCFLYHKMSAKLPNLDSLPDLAAGQFLQTVVQPLYRVVAKMREQALKHEQVGNERPPRPLDHKNIINYDDVNEFFWKKSCLEFNEYNIGEAMEDQELKTFVERRSIFMPFLSFYRLYFFLFVMFHVLTAIAYVGGRTDPDSYDGFKYYANFFSDTYADIRNHAIYSIFISIAGLSALKVVLQVCIDGVLIFSSKMFALSLFLRLIWHSVFFALFLAVNTSPYVEVGGSELLSICPVFIIVYMSPLVIAGIVNMFFKNCVLRTTFLKILAGKKDLYLGRHTKVSAKDFMEYSWFWCLLYLAKLIFNLQVMIKPLILPTIEIYDLEVTGIEGSGGLVVSNHNILFLICLWAPTFLVYMYDLQIWLVILQSIYGSFLGFRMKISHSSTLSDFVKKLKYAPVLFDQKISSRLARNVTVDGSGSIGTPEAQSRLRFAVVWNECISSFRLSDLLDDREAAILQYQISDAGNVEDPVFLLASKPIEAIEIASRGASKRWDIGRLTSVFEKRDLMDSVRNCADLTLDVLSKLFGRTDSGVIEVFRNLRHSSNLNQSIKLNQIGATNDALVELLATILDLPDVTSLAANMDLYNDEVMTVVQRVDSFFKCLELMLEEQWMADRLRNAEFLKTSGNLVHQKQQLITLFTGKQFDGTMERDDSQVSSASNANDSAIANCTRLFFLLTLDRSDSLPRCAEAQRRMSFFLNSLSMKMPSVESIPSMPSFSVITPYYNETVLYSIEELNDKVDSNPLFQTVEKRDRNLTILKYLITFHGEEWENFLERVGVNTLEEALLERPTQVRLWASMRGQTLARTVHGMMMYEDALKMLRWLEIGSDQSISHHQKIQHMEQIVGLKFSYVTSCQIYSQQAENHDPRAADIELLLKKYPNWRVSFVDKVPVDGAEECRYDCVLIKSNGDEIVEVYRYQLPGNPVIGEGKPENQNIAIPFTRGEFVQTIDMNQEHYFEEALKIPNFLATANSDPKNPVTIIGMKEHIFTAKASSLARFMTLQELVFVSLTMRVMARHSSRMHYGHPDIFEKTFVMSNGGVSKASKGINLSEDVFSGYNATLRGKKVTHEEFMQVGKGRDVTLSHINAFEAKLANGSAEMSLSRESYRLGDSLDFFRLSSIYYTHVGFYISNFITVVCVFVYAYAKLYVALHQEVSLAEIEQTDTLDYLADVLNTQFIFQFGMLLTIPLLATLYVERGFRQATLQIIELIVTLGPVFYIFETGTKSHFFDVAIMRGGSKYRGTGRGFAIIRSTFVSFFKEYAPSHYRKAVELMAVMVIFGIYGNFHIGAGSSDTNLDSYSSKSQSYGVASFAVWLLGLTWLLSPFIFNTDGFDFSKSRVDISNWMKWMFAEDNSEDEGSALLGSGDSWQHFWDEDCKLMMNLRWRGRIGYLLRESRHFFAMFYIFTFVFDFANFVYLGVAVGAICILIWLGGLGFNAVLKDKIPIVRGIIYILVVLCGVFYGSFILGVIVDWSWDQSLGLAISIYAALYGILQYLVILNGTLGLQVARWGLVTQLGFMFDMLVGLCAVIPLFIFSAIPFMSTLQTRMMYNSGFSKSLSTGSEFAAFISALVGILGGMCYGWLNCVVYSLGYVNDKDDNFINESFIYFLDQTGLEDFPTEMYQVYAAAASIVGVILAIVLGMFVGRRMSISISCILSIAGVGLAFAGQEALIIVGCCLCTAGTAMMAVSTLLYTYEISAPGSRGKGVNMFIFGIAIGYVISSSIVYSVNYDALADDWASSPKNTWNYELLYGSIPAVILLVVCWFFSESPVWLHAHKSPELSETALVSLRQKHDIVDDIVELKSQFEDKGYNMIFRLLMALLLQATYAVFTNQIILYRVYVKTSKSDEGNVSSKWLLYYSSMTLIGIFFGLFTIDNVRRKTILKDILPFCACLSVVCGIIQLLDVSEIIVEICLFVLYLTAGTSLSVAAWLSSIEMFPPSKSGMYIGISFSFYYAIQAVLYLVKPSFAISQFIFAALCVLLVLTLFSICASTKDGALQLKSEKARMKASVVDVGNEEETPLAYGSRVSRSQSAFRASRRRQSSRYQTRTPKEAMYETFESPAAGSVKMATTESHRAI